MPAEEFKPLSTPRSSRTARALVAVTALVFALLAAALIGAGPRVVAAWPWPEASMSFVFLGSITASVATVWASVALSAELAALAGVARGVLDGDLGSS